MKNQKIQQFSNGGLYGFTGEEFALGRSNLECVDAMLQAGVDVIQFREKEMSRQKKYRQCLEIAALCRRRGALFIVNDEVDLAIAVEADGVHLGQDDLPPAVARQQMGPDALIGLSTHSVGQYEAALLEPVDYIGVGPVYATRTKKDVCSPVGLEYLEYAAGRAAVPYVAIGGIKMDNLKPVLERGARRIAMITEIIAAEDIGQRVGQLLKILNSDQF